MCLQTKPKRDQLSVAVIRELLNCQMAEGGEKGREGGGETVTDREREEKENIELFSCPSIIQDVYYLLLCAAANFMPQRFLAAANNPTRACVRTLSHKQED